MEIEDLTDAQFRVADKVADGLTNKQIAIRLGLSVKTVENHLHNIYSKFRFISRYRLISMMLTSRIKDHGDHYTHREYKGRTEKWNGRREHGVCSEIRDMVDNIGT